MVVVVVGRVNGDAFSNKRRWAGEGPTTDFHGTTDRGTRAGGTGSSFEGIFFSARTRSTRSSIRRTCEKERAYLSWSLIMHRPEQGYGGGGWKKNFFWPNAPTFDSHRLSRAFFLPPSLSLSPSRSRASRDSLRSERFLTRQSDNRSRRVSFRWKRPSADEEVLGLKLL